MTQPHILDALTNRLIELASAHRMARGLDRDRTRETLREFGAELGDVDDMLEVWDHAVENHGYRAVAGVSGAWDHLNGWHH